MVSRPASGTSGISWGTTDRKTTSSWSTLLCRRWCWSTSGVPSTCAVKNTAVPGTRCGARQDPRAAPPGRHENEHAAGDGERDPAAVGDLEHVGRQERELHGEEGR